jgi:hypothetical protein
LRFSGTFTWAIWNSSRFLELFNSKVSKLQVRPCTTSCPCGAVRTQDLTMVRSDAAQYFKNCCVPRVARTALELLHRESVRTGYACLELVDHRKTIRWRKSAPSSRSRRFLSISEISDAITYSCQDSYFAIGPIVCSRKCGLPMGGSFSEALLLNDATSHVAAFAQDFAERFPLWPHADDVEKLLCGFQHVDDVLLVSGVLCAQCLSDVMRTVFPPDFNFTLEETGDRIDFLHTRIVWHPGPGGSRGSLRVLPKHANICALLSDSRLPQSRVPVYLDEYSTPKTMLRRFLHPHMHMQNSILAHASVDAITHVSVLLLEVHRSGWPNRAISFALLSVSSRHDSTLFGVCHRIGRLIRTPDGALGFWSLALQLASDILPVYS